MNLGLPEFFVLCLVLPILVAYIGLVCYVYQDARRRGMPYVMWTLLALFVPSGIGIILYFILRQPPLVSCASCRAAMPHGMAYCPQCGRAAGATCPQCKRVAQPGWAHCGWCGAKL